jgi:3-phosphoglycerate kinase
VVSVGVFEIPHFVTGTKELAEVSGCVGCENHHGDSVTAFKQSGLAYKMIFISTEGASLELLEGRELPEVATLADRGLGFVV